jgi:hypothetical protein
MNYVVIDTESDGLLDEATKIHVMSYSVNGSDPLSVFDYDQIEGLIGEWITSGYKLVGHNFIRHDMPLLNKHCKTNITWKDCIDTLALSWYLNFERNEHGLESYGETYGVPKPKVDDWHNLTPEEYAHRCQEDCKINVRLFKELWDKLLQLYGNEQEANRLILYLMHKMDCAREAEEQKWQVDVEAIQKHIATLEQQKEVKTVELAAVMPKVEKFKWVNKPKITHKKDGTLSTHGERWFKLLKDHKLPVNHSEPVKVHDRWEEPNPNSTDQIKDWLYKLGWEPETFKYVRNKETGDERKIEQVRVDGLLCDSVVRLAEQVHELKALEGLTIINHRLGFFQSMEKHQKNGYVKATIAGFTNTLRFKHSAPLANIPKVGVPWGQEIRGSLICGPDELLCGADTVSLEDTTKRHYMFPYDPEYVAEMQQPGFDPHLDLAVRQGVLTSEQAKAHVDGLENHKPVRHQFKQVNYAAIYEVRAKKLSRMLGISVKAAQIMLDSYWERNWSIRKVVKDQYIKQLFGTMWLKNPVSGFYHQLRYEKDIFSTLNQSTGVYVFDKWLYYLRSRGIKLIGQFHDEVAIRLKEGQEDEVQGKLEWAMMKLNQDVKLNVPIQIDIKFGKTYASVH